MDAGEPAGGQQSIDDMENLMHTEVRTEGLAPFYADPFERHAEEGDPDAEGLAGNSHMSTCSSSGCCLASWSPCEGIRRSLM